MGNWRFIREPVDGIHVTCVIPAKKDANNQTHFLDNAFLVIRCGAPALAGRIF